MDTRETALKVLIRQRYLTYGSFCVEWDRTAPSVDKRLTGHYPGRAQYYRWLRGELANGRPYPDACRMLEAMFSGWSVDRLFSPYTGSDHESLPELPAMIDADQGNDTGIIITQGANILQTATDPEAGEDADIMLMLAEADRTDIGPGTIESMYTIFDKLCRDYPSASASELQRKLKRLYARLMRLRQGRMTFAQHKELIALSGWVTALLACVDWDMNEREAAETARAATFRFAKEIDHAELIAWSYEMQAWFALTDGRYSDVTSIAKAAQTIGGENSAIVQLIMQEARGWAKLGNRNAAESAMERGYNLLQKLPPVDYPRHFIYDRSKYPFYAASCYQWLGEDSKAEKFVNEVIRDCETNGTTVRSPMRLAEVHITHGLIHAQRGDLEAAVDSGTHALTYERKSGPSLLIRATELGKAITARFPDAPVAAEFDERLRSVFEEFQYQPPEYG
jgi:tetratricopeptide (TPR) repeat protein